MSTMRAKFFVTKVEGSEATTTPPTSEGITMIAVTEKPFDAGGNSEDNSFATWTPSGELKMTITNPNLLGVIKEGQKYYLDFTEATEPSKETAP